MTSTFNGLSYLPLVFSTRTCITTWADFSILSNISFHEINVLIIDDQGLISAKLADPWSSSKTPSRAMPLRSFLSTFIILI
jgi:hypothetical protein